MTLREVIAELKRLGTAKNVKVYRRHGAGDNVYGVGFAELKKLKRRLGVDHPLAEQLWATGNSDAMTLATMVADPGRLTPSGANAWVRAVRYYVLADELGGLVARSPIALGRYQRWAASKQEFTRRTGYVVLGSLLGSDAGAVPEGVCRAALAAIERELPGSANLARHAMNGAVIAIGVYKPGLRKAALAAAGRIGRVEVDHGETGCKTPDAAAYIEKTVAHYRSRPARGRARGVV